MTNKHIAMWNCARSLSTVMSRAFEQLKGCLVQILMFLCNKFGLDFSEKMLSWEEGLKDSAMANLKSTSEAWAKTWYTTINGSSGFLPFEKKEEKLPDEFIPLLKECMPFYEKLFQHRVIFN